MDKFIIPKDATLFDVYKTGFISWFMRKGGFINPIYYRYAEVHQVYLKEGKTKTEAVKLTAIECGVGENTIWKALKAVK